MKNIFLIRHGESSQNCGINFVEGLPDHTVYLTPLGIQQAQEAAQGLTEYLEQHGVSTENSRIWSSPYKRARQTRDIFNEHLNIKDCSREDITLIEQQYGLFDSVDEAEWPIRFPAEYAQYSKYKDNQGKFYARCPGGESPFDVALRVHQFFGTIKRDEKSNIDNLFIFTHGCTLRAFLLRYFHYTPEWFEEQKNPKNCWIRRISKENGKAIDCGYINIGE